MVDFKALDIINDALIAAGYQLGDGGFDMINNVKDQDWYDSNDNRLFTMEIKFHKQEDSLDKKKYSNRDEKLKHIIELLEQAIATS
jgi:hypothetical protein